MINSSSHHGLFERALPIRNNSFGFARFVAASGVIFSHHFALSGFSEPNLGGVTIGGFSVRIFFLMSGYLIFLSLWRNPDIFRFCSARILRIVPNLVMVLTATSLFTCVVYGNYDRWLAHLRYVVQNTAMLLRGGPLYEINGIWDNRPYATLNGSLWSLPYEVWCYIVLFFIVAAMPKFSKILLPLMVLLCIGLFIAPSLRLWPLAISTDKLGSLGLWFFLGSVVAAYSLKIPFINSPAFARFETYGDPSYGMYIIAWPPPPPPPVQQACIIAFPNFWLSMAIAFFVTVLAGYLTWHLLEQRMLSKVGVLADLLRRCWDGSVEKKKTI